MTHVIYQYFSSSIDVDEMHISLMTVHIISLTQSIAFFY